MNGIEEIYVDELEEINKELLEALIELHQWLESEGFDPSEYDTLIAKAKGELI